MRNAPFEIRPIAGAIGAELHGVDLADDLSAETIGAIRQALLDHGVIFFRDQDLPPDRFLALARHFGTPVEYPFLKGIEGFPEIITVSKLENETINFGGVWHSDTTYLQEPPMATLLVAREVPEAGGDTIFANQYLAYETLSDGMKALLAGLKGVASSAKADSSRTREDRIKSDCLNSCSATRSARSSPAGSTGEAAHWRSGTIAARSTMRSTTMRATDASCSASRWQAIGHVDGRSDRVQEDAGCGTMGFVSL